ncbi:hypothetical protein SAY86_031057 [Trapa natans]|uniref:SANT domain-containing protein n=1 Tax=Trapa natans TaxID=22666 RepID=A0AAN7M3X4_TRANT|nr:hypothetical protein SAY86_031057 [Trapa natans]
MDSVEMSSNGNCIEYSNTEVLLPSESEQSNGYNVFGESKVLPRVGDEYQAQIPNLISGSDFIHLKLDPLDDTNAAFQPHIFHIGLPILVMWTRLRPHDRKHEYQESVSDACDSSIKTDDLKLDSKIKLDESENSELGDLETRTCKSSSLEGCFPVPGSLHNAWNESEERNFLLSLYIFRKNLINVKKFIENKSMGEILSFYYGKFYGSAEYQRWSVCRKIKSKKYIGGQKIFTGLRQQELLSRLLSQVPEECRSKLEEASRTYGEGKTSFEEYVFTLKAIVGLGIFVEATGIGKGKEDLTGIGNDHTKSSSQTALFCPEIPIGKACSALTTAEIVTFLTGNFRLSKARSNDLFWEAVWPRLLARGWHSEQPESSVFVGSRHSLVFLVPGIEKFSKRKLVKGDHYFDSVTDVLNRVASQPELLDLDGQPNVKGAPTGKDRGEILWDNEAKSDQGDSPDEERHCYLKARTPIQTDEGIKFTVVDTSMASDVSADKLRELRSLPSDLSFSSFGCHLGEEDSGDVESNSGNGSSNPNTGEVDLSEAVKVINGKKRVSSQHKYVENNKDLKNHHVKIPEFQPRQRVKPKSKKLRRLDASNSSQRSFCENVVSLGTRFDPAASCSSFNPHGAGDGNMNILQGSPCVETLSFTNSMTKDATVNSVQESENILGPCSVIDLNLPVFPKAESSTQGLQADAAKDDRTEPPMHHSNARSPMLPDNSEQQPNNGRRQSTRNRPLTTKALEALAFGLFDSKRKRKSKYPYGTAQRPPKREAKPIRPKEKSPEDKGIGSFPLDGVMKAN